MYRCFGPGQAAVGMVNRILCHELAGFREFNDHTGFVRVDIVRVSLSAKQVSIRSDFDNPDWPTLDAYIWPTPFVLIGLRLFGLRRRVLG
jgi:hypothetical protein